MPCDVSPISTQPTLSACPKCNQAHLYLTLEIQSEDTLLGLQSASARFRRAPVHALVHAARGRGRLAVEGDVPGGDAVAPPQLPADAPVPDVLQPPARRTATRQSRNPFEDVPAAH